MNDHGTKLQQASTSKKFNIKKLALAISTVLALTACEEAEELVEDIKAEIEQTEQKQNEQEQAQQTDTPSEESESTATEEPDKLDDDIESMDFDQDEAELPLLEEGFYAFHTSPFSSEEEDDAVDEYSDIVVNVNGKGLLIFGAENGYLPVWYSSEGIQSFEHLVEGMESEFDDEFGAGFEGDFDDESDGDFNDESDSDFDDELDGDLDDESDGDFNDELDGDFNDELDGDFNDESDGDFNDELNGDFDDESNGDFDDEFDGEFGEEFGESGFLSYNDNSFVRIIEQTPEQIVIHWRYASEPFAELSGDPEAVVHELFTIKANGEVTRLHRPGTDTITDWQKHVGALQQTAMLTEEGLKDVQTHAATELVATKAPEPNAVIAPADIGNPVAMWRFDEGEGNVVTGTVNNRVGEIFSHGNDWVPGVSGHALRLDGYRSEVFVSQEQAPDLGSEFAIEAWLYLDAYPWNNAPILQQVADAGFNFHVTKSGALSFAINDTSVTASDALPLRQWVHVSVSVGQETSLFVNGEEVGKTNSPAELDLNKEELILGFNPGMLTASDDVSLDEESIDEQNFDEDNFNEEMEYGYFSETFGLEAMLDEVVIHDRSLTGAEVQTSYQTKSSILANLTMPETRALPDLEQYPQKFGAYHTRLSFHDMWDNMWRVTEHEDIVVRFDNQPTSLVYWHGASHGMSLVTDGYWMTDQSIDMKSSDLEGSEAGEEFNEVETFADYMSDNAAQPTQVRVIENSAARVKIHWRYAAADTFGMSMMDSGFIDEVHTIYPDGITIRDVLYQGSEYLDDEEQTNVTLYQDFQWLIGPGQKAEDFMNTNAVSLAALSGGQTDVEFPYVYQNDGDGKSVPEAGSIAVLNSKTDWKVFGISADGGFYPATNEESSEHITFEGQAFPFAGPWNHWPVAQASSEERLAITNDRVAHFAVGMLEGAKSGSGAMMYGFTESSAESLGDPTKLQSLGKSWVTPPTVNNAQGLAEDEVVYNKNERAFELTMKDEKADASFDINASADAPVKNPAFVVHQWNSDNLPKVLINNAEVADAAMGIVRDTDGSRMLVIYAPVEHDSKVTVTIKRVAE